MTKKKIISILIGILIIVILIVGIYTIINPDQTVLEYYKIRNTPQKIGSRDSLQLGTITNVKDNHFFVTFADGKTFEYVVIRLTKYENGKKEDLKKGTKVGVIGSYDEDGTYIAKIIRFDTSSPLQMLQ